MNLRHAASFLWRLVHDVRNWPIYFLNRFGWIRSGTFAYRLRNGIRVWSRPLAIDGCALNDVWLERSYEPSNRGIPFAWEQCKTILDIGANIGTFTLYAAHYAPHAHIIAVEPEPGNVAMLQRNIEENHLSDRIRIHAKGIAPKRGTAQLFVSHKNSGGHSLFQYTEESHPVEVKLVTLQDIFDEEKIKECDYLKLDCEGGEYEGLYGLRPQTLRSIRFIAVECHRFSSDPRHNGPTLKKFLEENGFQVIEAKKSVFFAKRIPLSGPAN